MQITALERDILMVGEVAYAEARSEGQAGIRAQIHSVINRHNAVDDNGKPRWYSAKTLAGTVVAAYAYSAMNTADRNRQVAFEAPVDDPILVMCCEEAELAITGKSTDPTDGATHYYAAGTPEPAWVSGRDPKTGNQLAPPAVYCKRIGKHLFYKGVT